ncbi:tetraspanin-8 [Macrotis lagotis]|uniref:tetraspanin-8 n=1 Tax=Macrotis lagotis TaxID=92651 RepID=UPI003D697770
MAGVSGFIKYSMFIFNFIFWVCGCAILGVSIYARVSKDGQDLLSEEKFGLNIYASVNVLIAVGSIIMVLGFLGCCGAMKESRCMLLLFFIGLLLILLIQIAAGVVGIVFKSKIEQSFKDVFQEEVKSLSDNEPESLDFKNTLNDFQKQFKCCGLINGAQDWGNNFQKYSESCECKKNEGYTCVTYGNKEVYEQTCGDYMINVLKKNLVIVAGIAFGVAVIEILGLVFSMVLYCQIGQK